MALHLRISLAITVRGIVWTSLSGRIQKSRCRIGKPQGGRGRVKDGAIQMINMEVARVQKVVDKTTFGKGRLRVGTVEVTGTHGIDETVP